MNFTWDTQTGINLVLCIAIVAIGYLAWQRHHSSVILLVAVAFGLFGISHLASLLGIAGNLNTPLIVLRITGYVLVTLAVLLEARGQKPAAE